MVAAVPDRRHEKRDAGIAEALSAVTHTHEPLAKVSEVVEIIQNDLILFWRRPLRS